MSLAEVVNGHQERAVVRAGDVFIKVDTDVVRAAYEVEVLRTMTAVTVPEVLWTHPGPPYVMALATMPGKQLALLDQPSPHGPAAWRATGEALRTIHDSRTATAADEAANLAKVRAMRGYLEDGARWLVDNHYGDPDRVKHLAAEAADAIDAWTPATRLLHGDMQQCHVFIDDDDRVTGIIDWSDCGFGDPLADIAVLTQGHREFLDDVIAGYGENLDRDLIATYRTIRLVTSLKWLVEHGYDIADDLANLQRG